MTLCLCDLQNVSLTFLYIVLGSLYNSNMYMCILYTHAQVVLYIILYVYTCTCTCIYLYTYLT